MSAVPADRHLIEFATDLGHGKRGKAPAGAANGAGEAASDSAALLEAAFARGAAAGRAEAKGEFDAKLAHELARLAAEHAAERVRWVRAEAQRMSDAWRSTLDELAKAIADSAGRVLKPFLAAALRRKATQELAATLDELLAKEGGLRIHLSGPEDLLETIAAGLEARASVTREASASCDVRVEVGQTVLVAHLGAWLATLDEAAP
jgi:hypothetical protein